MKYAGDRYFHVMIHNVRIRYTADVTRNSILTFNFCFTLLVQNMSVFTQRIIRYVLFEYII